MNKLAVVLISKNQAWNIGRLIRSVIQETRDLTRKEILLVDSASTDDTIRIASEYPIKIIRLHPDQHLTPAAGRYVGMQNTDSEYVLFLDGDMELYSGWLDCGLEVIEQNTKIAAITGERIDLPKQAGKNDKPPLVTYDEDRGIEVGKSGGAAMYRRALLNKVGSFNPFLYSDEEPDLCLRLRHSGYKIFKLHHPISYHFSDTAVSLKTKYARWKRNLYLGAGQNLRYHWRDKLFWKYLKERGYGIVPALGITGGVISLLWYFITGNKFIIQVVGSAFILFILADLVKRRSFHKTGVSLCERLFIADGTIRGFLLTPYPPDTYPKKYDQIK
ncbi:glycosyltransferase family 2 protein [Acidobacteriota bacterium]